MSQFKFFAGKVDDYVYQVLPEETASWIWATELVDTVSSQNFDILTAETNGIINFLGMFPNHYRVVVLTIEGPNDIIHDGTTRTGWGFNIQTDPLKITYLRFID